jgi:hypothetical protein
MWFGYRNAGEKRSMVNFENILERFSAILPGRKNVRYWRGISNQTTFIY